MLINWCKQNDLLNNKTNTGNLKHVRYITRC